MSVVMIGGRDREAVNVFKRNQKDQHPKLRTLVLAPALPSTPDDVSNPANCSQRTRDQNNGFAWFHGLLLCTTKFETVERLGPPLYCSQISADLSPRNIQTMLAKRLRVLSLDMAFRCLDPCALNVLSFRNVRFISDPSFILLLSACHQPSNIT